MPRRLRWFEPNVIFEVTSRTIDGRFLLRPDDASREIILGVMARAKSLYPEVAIYSFVFMSNHFHILLSAAHGDQLAKFMSHIKGNIAKQIGKLRGWLGALWHRRSSLIPITDGAAMISRFKYVLAQSTKEGLVESPELWPGASSISWLLGNQLFGTWVDRALARKARSQHPDVSTSHQLVYEIPLSPIPEWRELSRKSIAANVRALLDVIASEAHGRSVVGVAAVQEVDPYSRPHARLEERAAPLCHSSCRKLRVAFHRAYRSFVSAFRQASDALKRHPKSELVNFPVGSFPPSSSFIRAREAYAPYWTTHLASSEGGEMQL